ncbi:CRISPR-associated protein Cas5 [Thermodesulfovibrionales bacterium]|nr:CRISPR-associated protein Cas5 [Thermodesulfovibrionales bacterium]
MFAFIIKAFAITASFRIPESHTFQQTLPLPPITTLTGLMGAALGLNFENAMKFREQKGILFGVIGSCKGEMRDLWKYNKIKLGESLKDVLIREYLTDFSLTIGVGSKDKTTLSEVKDCFYNPKYALAAGNSDDLLKVCRISDIVEAKDEQGASFENTVLPGDQTVQYESLIDLKNTPITYKVRSPQVFLLPTAFKFDNEERRVSKREQFTFVGSPIRLKNPILAYKVDGVTVALL